jgi:hypothetical protein
MSYNYAIFITITIFQFRDSYEIHCLLLSEENNDNEYKLRFFLKVSRRGFLFATADKVQFELPSEGMTDTAQCYRIETRIN